MIDVTVEERAPGATASWRDLVIPVLIALLLVTAAVALFLATTALATDPMVGT